MLAFNVNDLVNQLTSVDYDELAKRVDALCETNSRTRPVNVAVK